MIQNLEEANGWKKSVHRHSNIIQWRKGVNEGSLYLDIIIQVSFFISQCEDRYSLDIINLCAFPKHRDLVKQLIEKEFSNPNWSTFGFAFNLRRTNLSVEEIKSKLNLVLEKFEKVRMFD